MNALQIVRVSSLVPELPELVLLACLYYLVAAQFSQNIAI